MNLLPRRIGTWLVSTVVIGSALLPVAHATAPISHPDQFLDQTEQVRTADHPRFLQMLQAIGDQAPSLTPSEQWRVRYLEAWEIMFEGDYAKSALKLQEVIDHSGDQALVYKSYALLLSNYSINARYSEAFALANRLTSDLPLIKDPLARFLVLDNLSQMMDDANQIDLAVTYARMMESAVPPGESLCRPYTLQAAALYNGSRLTSTSAELQRAIDTCTAAGDPVFINSNWLVMATLYTEEHHPEKALAVLDRLAPSVAAAKYYPHVQSSQVERAQAYAALGDDNKAKQYALAAVAMSQPSDVGGWLMNAYELLYQIEKKQGHSAAALAYYERYATDDKKNTDDIAARTLAYEVAKQNMLMQQIETDRLNNQNDILRLQQTLDRRSTENDRLYIALLLMTLASIGVWLVRLQRLHYRFKHFSRRDELTGILNRQHFMNDARHALQAQQKKQVSACLVYVDVNRFKHINITHGHDVGDAVLKRIADVCQHYLRPMDVVGRLGGKEFALLLLDCSLQQGMVIAERMRIAIAATSIDSDHGVVWVTASIGLVCTETFGYDLPKLCTEACAALLRAKHHRRNRAVADTENDGAVEA